MLDCPKSYYQRSQPERKVAQVAKSDDEKQKIFLCYKCMEDHRVVRCPKLLDSSNKDQSCAITNCVLSVPLINNGQEGNELIVDFFLYTWLPFTSWWGIVRQPHPHPDSRDVRTHRLLFCLKCPWNDPLIGNLAGVGSTAWRSLQRNFCPCLKCDLSISASQSQRVRVAGLCVDQVLGLR